MSKKIKEEQSFFEYTEERIADYTKINDIFPEFQQGINLIALREAYGYEDHMVKTKEQLEKFCGRSLTWYEVDNHSNFIFQFVIRQCNFPVPTTMEESIEYRVLARKKFCDYIGLDFNEVDLDAYKQAVKTSMLNHIALANNLRKRDTDAESES